MEFLFEKANIKEGEWNTSQGQNAQWKPQKTREIRQLIKARHTDPDDNEGNEKGGHDEPLEDDEFDEDEEGDMKR